jgi:hypothetical protein
MSRRPIDLQRGRWLYGSSCCVPPPLFPLPLELVRQSAVSPPNLRTESEPQLTPGGDVVRGNGWAMFRLHGPWRARRPSEFKVGPTTIAISIGLLSMTWLDQIGRLIEMRYVLGGWDCTWRSRQLGLRETGSRQLADSDRQAIVDTGQECLERHLGAI